MVTHPFSFRQASVESLRLGVLHLPHGDVPTPVFQPIATRGGVRVASFATLRALGTPLLLANTFHLTLRPGVERIRHFGGLHQFLGWEQPILTDSGGFQVFSLKNHRVVTDAGVHFRSPVDGAEMTLTPEGVIRAQWAFGSDISMVLDEVCALPAASSILARAVSRTSAWAQQSHEVFSSLVSMLTPPRPLLFGIVQGGIVDDLRIRSAQELVRMHFDGYAIGGLSVGESREDMLRSLDVTIPLLPIEQPRYLMGVGEPEDILEAVRRGIDMFDCVLPTRNARHALLYADLDASYLAEILRSPLKEPVEGRRLYRRLHIMNEPFRDDTELLNPHCSLLAGVTRGYLCHLFHVDPPVAVVLATIQNLWFYLSLMKTIHGTISKLFSRF